LAAYTPDGQAVLAQLRVDARTNELKAALEMLAILPINKLSQVLERLSRP
jgi:hypothetical protein